MDTGALDCMVPRKHLESIGLEPKGKRVYEMADGSEIRMDVTTSPEVEFMGEVVGATIVIGDARWRAAARGDGVGVGRH